MSPTPKADEHASATAPGPFASVQVVVNGEDQSLSAGATVETLVANLGLGGRRVAVACNQRVVPRSSYDQPLVNGDRLEILEAVGGG